MGKAAQLAALVALLGSCSLALHDSPPAAATGDRYHSCDEARTWPGVDTALAGLFAANAIKCSLENPCENESGAGKTGALVALTALATAFAVSAYRGFRGAARCREVHAAFAAGRGTEGRDCRPDSSCDAGLICASNLCVRPR